MSSKSEMSRETDALGLDSDAQVTVGLYDSNGKYAMTEDFRWAQKVKYFLGDVYYVFFLTFHCNDEAK